MNAESHDNNDPLRKAMQHWRVSTPLPPGFQEQVWQRIERAEATRKPTLLAALDNWFQITLPRRAVAASYLTVLLALGLTGGYWQARQKMSRLEDRLSTRYVQSVDPYQMPRH